jgi:DNA polymerase-1
MSTTAAAPPVVDELVRAGVLRGELVGLVVSAGQGFAVAVPERGFLRSVAVADPVPVVAEIEAALRPRWVWWSNATPTALLPHQPASVRFATCWDLAAVHRLLFGGWRADPELIWAALHDLDPASVPAHGQLDLLSRAGDDGGDSGDPVQPDGHLRPAWLKGGWSRSESRWRQWATLAVRAAVLQQDRLQAHGEPRNQTTRLATARSESAAELLCAELGFDGLPVRPDRAREIVAGFVGPRPRDAADARAIRDQRDEAVLRHVPGGDVDLRSPGQVKAMLLTFGIDVPDTRSWRLEVFRDVHPVVPALLRWRKDERFATTYGYEWLDRQVGTDGRLRGSWTGCDGGAGRMTASAGLHSLPGELRPAIAADEGHIFVRADLGQIEPRVLAAVSGDRGLSLATRDDDLYAPVAARLGVDRPTAKVAVLAAMYGQTSGAAGEALKGMDAAYPVAMRYLREANEAGRAGRSVRTYGGRLIRMWPTPDGLDDAAVRASTAARGRFARNAVVQGAAAELFKVWAVMVRARSAPMGGRIVMCLHDELIVHAPAEHGPQLAKVLHDCLQQAAGTWAPEAQPGVRFVADVSVISTWSEAKG